MYSVLGFDPNGVTNLPTSWMTAGAVGGAAVAISELAGVLGEALDGWRTYELAGMGRAGVGLGAAGGAAALAVVVGEPGACGTSVTGEETGACWVIWANVNDDEAVDSIALVAVMVQADTVSVQSVSNLESENTISCKTST